MGRGRQLVPGASKYAVSKPAAGRGPGSLAGAAVPAGSIGGAAVKSATVPSTTSAPSSSTASSKQQGPGAVLTAKAESTVPSTGGVGKAVTDTNPLSSQTAASRNSIAPDPGGAGDHSGDQGGIDSTKAEVKAKSESSSKPAVVTGKASDHGAAAAEPSATSVAVKGDVSNSRESGVSSALSSNDLKSSAAADTADPKQRGRWSPIDK